MQVLGRAPVSPLASLGLAMFDNYHVPMVAAMSTMMNDDHLLFGVKR
jgi:hypothetical protein